MSFREVVIAMQGYNNQFEITEQFQWERIRWQTTLLLNVHTAKGKNLKPKDLIEFPWETPVKKGWTYGIRGGFAPAYKNLDGYYSISAVS